jgi:acetyl-CoA carboxylase carboxyl transferase subunit alpha
MDILQLEKPLTELSNKISQLKLEAEQQARVQDKSSTFKQLTEEIASLEQTFNSTAQDLFKNLSCYQIAQISRHPSRPYTNDIISQLCSSFIELHGDRNFMDDQSLITGIAVFKGHRVAVIGHQKGRNTRENMKRNFGMSRPEGYRKALRIMSLAERFSLPIITFIDTPGAYPGMDAEERGQSEAIAKNIMVMSRLKVPIISVVVGEGGSGGALAIGVANRVLMMQYSTYSVISPEGCASILWKDSSMADKAANVLGLTADVALKNKIIDEIIQEPLGGAHWKPADAIDSIGNVVEKHLNELLKLNPEQLKENRIHKFFKMGPVKKMPAISPFRRESSSVSSTWEESWDSIEDWLYHSKNS